MVSLCLFSCVWSVVKVYSTREHLQQVAVKPPNVPVSSYYGLQRFWYVRMPYCLYILDNAKYWQGIYSAVKYTLQTQQF